MIGKDIRIERIINRNTNRAVDRTDGPWFLNGTD